MAQNGAGKAAPSGAPKAKKSGGTKPDLATLIGIALAFAGIVGGLILSQLLTLYTTPVVYLAFDWLAHRFSFQIGNSTEEPAHGD